MVLQLVYASRPFGFDDLALSGILFTARANNARHGITGALICREDLYLQLLEGEAEWVHRTFDNIRRDDRHTDVEKLLAEEAGERLFPNWAMRHDPVRSWMWTRDAVRAGAVKNASGTEILGVFSRLSKEPAATVQL